MPERLHVRERVGYGLPGARDLPGPVLVMDERDSDGPTRLGLDVLDQLHELADLVRGAAPFHADPGDGACDEQVGLHPGEMSSELAALALVAECEPRPRLGHHLDPASEIPVVGGELCPQLRAEHRPRPLVLDHDDAERSGRGQEPEPGAAGRPRERHVDERRRLPGPACPVHHERRSDRDRRATIHVTDEGFRPGLVEGGELLERLEPEERHVWGELDRVLVDAHAEPSRTGLEQRNESGRPISSITVSRSSGPQARPTVAHWSAMPSACSSRSR